MVSVTCRTLATVALLAAATAGLSACNTLNGVGKDASAAGHDLSNGVSAGQHAVNNRTGLANN